MVSACLRTSTGNFLTLCVLAPRSMYGQLGILLESSTSTSSEEDVHNLVDEVRTYCRENVGAVKAWMQRGEEGMRAHAGWGGACLLQGPRSCNKGCAWVCLLLKHCAWECSLLSHFA